ncbi:MAG TPA: hypothetical protein VGG19_15420 [Tepidisphaeraceae bacterium]|jgi:hypothetical protein
MKHTASANVSSKSSSNGERPVAYVMCVDNAEYPVSLEVGKVYPVLRGASKGFLRIIDESGEDYVFGATRFVKIQVPPRGRRVLSGAS